MDTIRFILTGLVILAIAATAMAEAGDDGHFAPDSEAKIPWRSILYIVVALGGIAAVGFKNAKRTHLD